MADRALNRASRAGAEAERLEEHSDRENLEPAPRPRSGRHGRQLALDAKMMRDDAAFDTGVQNHRWWEGAIHRVSENWDTVVEIREVIVGVPAASSAAQWLTVRDGRITRWKSYTDRSQTIRAFRRRLPAEPARG